jgi:protein-tyrosine kinase
MATVVESKRISELPTREERSERLIGELLVELGALRAQDVSRVVTTQREKGLRFGEAARRLGLIRQTDLDRALSRQFDYPYVDAETSSLSPLLAAAFSPFDAYAESLRGLRSQLLLRWFNDRRKTLAVVAARDGEGATEVAANLAIVFAQLGERTLLVEANLRKPRLHELFGVDPDAGLSSVLSGRVTFPQAIRRIEGFEHLALICAGASVPNPQELLSKVMFSYFMETIPASFDIVIVDTPPVLENADAQIVTARSGGCIMVTRRHKTKLADIEAAKGQLQASGAPMLGALVID